MADVADPRRLEQRASILLDLAKSPNVGSGNLAAALREITEAAARALEVARASVWFYSDDKREIRCIDLFQAATNEHVSGAVLLARDYPRYFEALDLNRTIPANDAHTDWRTCEFSKGYLEPLGISSMLDAPLHAAGEMIGVVCHEHVGPPRQWTLDEQSFAGSIADYTALAIQAEELKRAREAAEQASRAKSVLLANLSHELRTPLNSIIGFSELLQEKVEPSLRPKLATIESSGRELLEMINELLEMASLEAGLATLDVQAIDLASLLEAIVENARGTAAKRGNQIVITGEVPRVVMHGDQERLWRVLWNLLDNASKFTENGTITLDVQHTGDRVKLTVRDSGIGMTPEQLAVIFQPFMQADSSLRRRYGGAGLGLAITRRLCELMRGTIDATSTSGAGSAFTVTLPLH